MRKISKGQISNIFNNVGYVPNPTMVVEILHKKAKQTLDIHKINLNAKSISLCFDNNFNVTDINSPDAKIQIIKTGYTDDIGQILYASFTKAGTRWQGAYIGYLRELVESLCKYYTNVDSSSLMKLINKVSNYYDISNEQDAEDLKQLISNNITVLEEISNIKEEEIETPIITGGDSRHRHLLELCKDIYNKCLVPSVWGGNHLSNLQSHVSMIYTMCIRHSDGLIKEIKPGYCMNNDKTEIFFNTGILDRSGNFIIVYATRDKDGAIFCSTIQPQRKITELDNFDVKAAIAINEYMIPTTTPVPKLAIHNFNTNSVGGCRHIVTEGRDRIPSTYQNLPDIALQSLIMGAAQRAIQIASARKDFAIMYYSGETDQWSCALPLILTDKDIDNPELYLILSYDKSSYWISTVYEKDWVARKLRFLYPSEIII